MISGYGDEFTEQDEDARDTKLYWGTVRYNNDPLKIGRVKVCIPNVADDCTDWAAPVGMPGTGYKSKGSYNVPRVGSLVLVGFVMGEFSSPFYLPGPPHLNPNKTSAVNANVAAQSPEQAPNVRVISETETFEIYIKDTTSEKKLVIKTLSNAGEMIELDMTDGSIHIKASKYLILEAPFVSIDGAVVQIKNRPVIPTGQSI